MNPSTYLFVYYLETNHSELVAAFTGKGFLAEPHWRDNDKEIVVAFFENIKDELAARRRSPTFNLPLQSGPKVRINPR